MKNNFLEKATVAVLFVLVLVVFSFAQRDSKKLVDLYTKKSAQQPSVKSADYTAESAAVKANTTRN